MLTLCVRNAHGGPANPPDGKCKMSVVMSTHKWLFAPLNWTIKIFTQCITQWHSRLLNGNGSSKWCILFFVSGCIFVSHSVWRRQRRIKRNAKRLKKRIERPRTLSSVHQMRDGIRTRESDCLHFSFHFCCSIKSQFVCCSPRVAWALFSVEGISVRLSWSSKCISAVCPASLCAEAKMTGAATRWREGSNQQIERGRVIKRFLHVILPRFRFFLLHVSSLLIFLTLCSFLSP